MLVCACARVYMPEENSSKGIVSSARPVTLLQLTAIAEATTGMAYGDDYRFHEKTWRLYPAADADVSFTVHVKQLRHSCRSGHSRCPRVSKRRALLRVAGKYIVVSPSNTKCQKFLRKTYTRETSRAKRRPTCSFNLFRDTGTHVFTFRRVYFFFFQFKHCRPRCNERYCE